MSSDLVKRKWTEGSKVTEKFNKRHETLARLMIDRIGDSKQRRFRPDSDRNHEDYDANQFVAPEVEMGVLGASLLRQTKNSHAEIQRRIGQEDKAAIEKHLLTTPPITPTKFSYQNVSPEEDPTATQIFIALVERDRRLNYLANDL